MPILLKLDSDYADEFNCEQFAIIFNATLEQVLEALKQACVTTEGTEEVDNEMYFGTNEFLYGDGVLRDTKTSEISVTKAEALISALGLDNLRVRASAYPVFTFGTGVLNHITDHLYSK